LLIPFIFAKESDDLCLCANKPLRVAEYNVWTEGTTYLLQRVEALAGLTPGIPGLKAIFDKEDIDIMCLTELYQDEMINLALSQFLAEPKKYNVYIPPTYVQSGCQDACFDNSTALLQSCAGAILPELGFPCFFLPDMLSFQSCVATACPDLLGILLETNPQCLFCATTQLSATETNADIIERCSARPYNPTYASNCVFALNGSANTPIVSKAKHKFLETDYLSFPVAINPITNNGVSYARVSTDKGIVNFFCGHYTTVPDSTLFKRRSETAARQAPNPFYLANQAEVNASLAYINKKVKSPSETVLFLADTNTGTGNKKVGSYWPDNYNLFLKSGLKDAIPLQCTWGCNYWNSNQPLFLDHIFGKKGKVQQNEQLDDPKPKVCFKKPRLFMTQNYLNVSATAKAPLSDHSGVITDVCIGNKPEHFHQIEF
jgi:hypothetical protein